MRRLERVANVALVVAVLLFGVTKIQEYRHASHEGPAPRRGPNPIHLVGKVFSVSDRFKTPRSATLVLALSTRCVFCAASMPFYRRLLAARKSGELRIVALVSQGHPAGVSYLSQNGIDPNELDDIRSDVALAADIAATPTILLLDRSDRVTRVWVGALNVDQEKDVFAKARDACANCL
jgi:Redoxin.